MLWGCFSWNGVGSLVQIEGIMNVDKYIEIICENLEEAVLGLEEKLILQQDNNPKHTAKKTNTFFENSNIKLLEWPAQSPDLNLIENLWSVLDPKVPLEKRKNKNDCFKNMQLAFENIDKNYTGNLINSIPRRLEAIIKAKSGHTKY